MPSLRQILPADGPLLLLDATSARIQVGVHEGPGSWRWAASDEEAGVGIFRGLEALAVDLARVRTFAFADAPGSLLGVRIAAMALRVWRELSVRPIFAYNALALAAAALGRPELTLIADARRGEWHCCRLGRPLWRQPAEGLEGPVATPAEFRAWSPLPEGVERFPYHLPSLVPAAAEADLFRPTEAPEACLPDAPNYVTWTPQIHRAS